jgi:hypothetical protein
VGLLTDEIGPGRLNESSNDRIEYQVADVATGRVGHPVGTRPRAWN